MKYCHISALCLIFSCSAPSGKIPPSVRVTNVDQTKEPTFAELIKLDDKRTIGFLHKSEFPGLYYSPRIIEGNKVLPIEGYYEENAAGKLMNLSPDGNYLMMDHIVIGWLKEGDGKDSTFYENYHCVLINLQKAKVVLSMQTNCGGEWNSRNEWVVNDTTLLFSPLWR